MFLFSCHFSRLCLTNYICYFLNTCPLTHAVVLWLVSDVSATSLLIGSIIWLLMMITGEGSGHPLQYSCLENPMDRGAWWAAVHGVARSRTRLSNFPFTFPFHALEKEMATHSSILAWRIPGMAELGGLPSMGSNRVRHDWSDLAAMMIMIRKRLQWKGKRRMKILYEKYLLSALF